ncbi:MAG TPA: PAS domain S-box protein, partial [Burkholderiales bacterium]|nr:PAS domain S-box protein [Burkholderiales bacterium]
MQRIDLRGAIAAACVLLLAAIWAGVSSYARSDEEAELARAANDSRSLAIAFEDQTATTLGAVDRVLRFLRHEYAIHGAKLDLPRYVRQDLIDERLFTSIGVFDEQGRLVTGVRTDPAQPAAESDNFRFHLREARDLLEIGTPQRNPASGKWTMPLSRRIDNAGGGFAGIVVLGLNPAHFTEAYERANPGANGMLALVGLDGVTRVMRTGQQASFGLDLSGGALLRAQALEPAGNYVSSGEGDGITRLLSYRTLAGYPLIAVAGGARDELLAPFEARRERYYFGATFAGALLVLLCGALIAALTRQKQLQRALAVRESRFRATFDHAAVGMIFAGENGRIELANRKFCEIVGYSREEVARLDVDRLTHPDDRRLGSELRSRLEAGELEVFSNEKR